MKQVIHTEHAPAAIGPYSQAVKIGDLLFTSGQIPVDPATGAVPEGGIQAQAQQSLSNIKAILNAAGTNMGAVIKTTVFLSDMNDFAAMNEVYAQFFQEPYPARSAVQVARLPKDVLVEIEAIAQPVFPGSSQAAEKSLIFLPMCGIMFIASGIFRRIFDFSPVWTGLKGTILI